MELLSFVDSHTLLLLLTTLIAIAHFVVRKWDVDEVKYPDAVRYLLAGTGTRVHKPFHLRWLLPFVLRDSERAWRIANAVALVALSPLTMLYLESLGLATNKAFFGSLLVPGLPGIFRIATACPYLVDTISCTLIVASATLINNGYLVAGVAVAILAACVKESSPIFIALFSQSVYPLVGLLAVGIRQLFWKANPQDIFDATSKDILDHPFRWGRKLHKNRWFVGELMLFPWGACLLGFGTLAHPSKTWWVAASLVIAYAQTAIATDSVRLYQYAFPALAFGTMLFMPIDWAPIVILLHWFNPYQKNYL